MITVITTIVLLTGCGTTLTAHPNTPTTTTAPAVVTPDSATPTTPSSTSETKNQPYSIITATFSQDNIKVQYPQIRGLGDDSKEKTINDLIKNDVLNSQVEAPIKAYQDATHTKVLTLDLKYQVTMNTTKLLSVVYTGRSNIVGSAHPNEAIYAITIDLKNATKLKLADFTIIDTNLAQKIKQSTAVTNEAVKNGMDKNGLITLIQIEDDQTLIKGLKEEWAYNTFYVTPNSLVVSVDVAHAAGDYVLVELPGKYAPATRNKLQPSDAAKAAANADNTGAPYFIAYNYDENNYLVSAYENQQGPGHYSGGGGLYLVNKSTEKVFVNSQIDFSKVDFSKYLAVYSKSTGKIIE